MSDIICNTSPLQYLHQIGHLELLARLARRVILPTAVADELREGRRLGCDLPVPEELEWIELRQPSSACLPRRVAALGPGETGVLALALECRDPVVILDDALARRYAEASGLRLTGTLGVLLDAKRAGLIAAIAPLVTALQQRGFRLNRATRQAVLNAAGETDPRS